MPRFNDFSNKLGPENLDAIREILPITDAQVRTIEHEELGVPMPAGVEKKGILRFPTPGKVIKKLTSGVDKRRMLERLYFEYSFLSIFVHGLPTAGILKKVQSKDFELRELWSGQELKETFHKLAMRVYTASFISIAQSVAELTAIYPENVDLVAAAAKAWEKMSKDSLLGKAIWQVRTKNLLGVLG